MKKLNAAQFFILSLAAFFAALMLAGFFTQNSDESNSYSRKGATEPPVAHTDAPVTQKKLVVSASTTPVLRAGAAFAAYVDENGSLQTLYRKNEKSELPIASITKLMTAHVARKYLPGDAKITISQAAVDQYETAGKLKVGQTFTRDELLYPLLIESSNDAAFSYAETYGNQRFIDLMNNEAAQMGLAKTTFINAHGLDNVRTNVSTAEDIAKLATHLYLTEPTLLGITTNSTYHLANASHDYDEILTNTDKLLQSPDVPFKIEGGKTGETPKAKQTLVLVLKEDGVPGFFVSVILDSPDRVKDMLSLTLWMKESTNYR